MSEEWPIAGLFGATEQIVIHKRWTEPDSGAGSADVLTWLHLHLPGVPPTAVASWIQVRNGAIQRVQVTFDPRGILSASG